MPSDIYWIDLPQGPKLAIMARPRAGDWLEDEVAHWQRSDVGIVLSLLEPEEENELQLGIERAVCARSGIEFRSFPIPDRGVPQDVGAALELAGQLAKGGRPVAIHCRAGIGRSSLMAAAFLISAGVSAEVALAAIETARGLPVPDTEAQRDWVLKLKRP